MSTCNSLKSVFKSSKEIYIDDSSKLILMSDIHRGNNTYTDKFSNNSEIYLNVLNHYYNNNFTYIELGDGDELWEYKNLSDIIDSYPKIFNLLSEFHNDNRLYFIYGNHDIVKRKYKNKKKFFFKSKDKFEMLFKNINCHEGLILNYHNKGKVFLTHGHQVDFFNCKLWRLSKFLVRYFWYPLDLYFGIKDKTSPAKNYKKKNLIEKEISEWVKTNNQVTITGHTHRARFPKLGEIPFFNTGSCVYPGDIIGIEIQNGEITLVKWYSQNTSNNIKKVILGGPQKLENYFNNS